MNQQLPSEEDFDSRDVISFEQVQHETEEFEAVLNRYGIEILSGSQLEKMCFSLLELKERERSKIADTMDDLRVLYRPAFGLHDLVRRIVRLHNRPDFPVLLDHLRLLNTGTVAQNIAAPIDQVAAKIFELLVGLICLECGADISLDGPMQSYGDNPDILVNLDARRWGFACKVLSGKSPITMFDRLKEGIEQIERSPAQIGCVVFNLKNRIDHDKTWPLVNPQQYAAAKETPTYAYWADVSDPTNILRAHARECHRELVTAYGAEHVRMLFNNKKSITGALLFLQTMTGLQFSEGPVNTVLGLFHLMDEGVSPADAAVLNKLNDALHHH
jgi:hypothetical protein